MTDASRDLVPAASDFLLYAAPDGAVKVHVLLKDETVWLTQKAIAELFAVKVPAISKHLKSIFASGELLEKSVVSILETTATDGKCYKTRFFNLDAIISVGYRVNSHQATQFRIWATRTLREFIVKGFVLDHRHLRPRGGLRCRRDQALHGPDDLAENRARRGILMKMTDWASFLDRFLELSSYPILTDRGSVSSLEAKLKAESEYEVYRTQQDKEYLSDFDRIVEETRRLEGEEASQVMKPAKRRKDR